LRVREGKQTTTIIITAPLSAPLLLITAPFITAIITMTTIVRGTQNVVTKNSMNFTLQWNVYS
jgi:hypothetical protein